MHSHLKCVTCDSLRGSDALYLQVAILFKVSYSISTSTYSTVGDPRLKPTAEVVHTCRKRRSPKVLGFLPRSKRRFPIVLDVRPTMIESPLSTDHYIFPKPFTCQPYHWLWAKRLGIITFFTLVLCNVTTSFPMLAGYGKRLLTIYLAFW